ncbi:MAG TPA: hypothetical protein DDW20_03375 [Firmicutes bacterium]|nr:hypothetical protein [Bacillota bacterium]
MKQKKQKQPITYQQAHNKAVKMYQKTSIFLMWAGLLNIFAIIIGAIQLGTNSIIENLSFKWPTSGFALNFTLQIFLNCLILKSCDLLLANFLMILIAIVLGAGFACLGVFASKGRIKILLIGTGLYALDFIAMFFVYIYSGVPSIWTNYAFTLACHVVVLVGMIIAIVEYYNVLHIEKVFKGDNKIKIEEEVESEVIANGK